MLGVDDKAPKRETALVGVEPALSLDAIRKGVFDRTRPNLTVSAKELFEDRVRLVVISVDLEGIELYANAKGLATRRLGNEGSVPSLQSSRWRSGGHAASSTGRPNQSMRLSKTCRRPNLSGCADSWPDPAAKNSLDFGIAPSSKR